MLETLSRENRPSRNSATRELLSNYTIKTIWNSLQEIVTALTHIKHCKSIWFCKILRSDLLEIETRHSRWKYENWKRARFSFE